MSGWRARGSHGATSSLGQHRRGNEMMSIGSDVGSMDPSLTYLKAPEPAECAVSVRPERSKAADADSDGGLFRFRACCRVLLAGSLP